MRLLLEVQSVVVEAELYSLIAIAGLLGGDGYASGGGGLSCVQPVMSAVGSAISASKSHLKTRGERARPVVAVAVIAEVLPL